MNKLRRIFNPTLEEEEEDIQKLKSIAQQLVDDRCCSMCKNSIPEPHYEGGYDAGSDPYCPIRKELILEYGYGQQCLWWELKKDALLI